MIILFLIINNQVRFFSLSSENKFILISYFLELILIFIFCKYIKTFNPLYYVSLILDASFLIKEKYKYILFSLVIIFSFIIGLDKNLYLALESSSTLLIITLFSVYLENENLSKLYNQSLYDKLRVSKDELKKLMPI